jgi:hypothetical protein
LLIATGFIEQHRLLAEELHEVMGYYARINRGAVHVESEASNARTLALSVWYEDGGCAILRDVEIRPEL